MAAECYSRGTLGIAADWHGLCLNMRASRGGIVFRGGRRPE
ncbi:MAG: hypothetical protein OXG81_16275 [Acidobacteria bacterium]|nr:hypothetical protein [Acidobacteriota bacterium]